MGLLKHAVLPILALVDLVFTYKCLVAEEMDLFNSLWDRDTSKFPTTDLEIHFLHCLGGAVFILLINNIAAIFIENSHYRGMAVLLHTIFMSVDLYSYVLMGKDPTIALSLFAIGVVGLVVHSMEPGIFTKDKNDGKKKK